MDNQVPQGPEVPTLAPESTPVSGRPSKRALILVSLLAIFILVIAGGVFYKLSTKNPPTQTLYNSARPSASNLNNPQVTQSPSPMTQECHIKGYYGQEIGAIVDSDTCKVTNGITDLSSYQLEYPINWEAHIPDAGGVNMLFNDNTPQSIYIGSLGEPQFPLNQSDKAVYQFENSSAPVIGDGEKITNKSLTIISGKNVFFVKTSTTKVNYNYYFLDEDVDGKTWLFYFKIQDNSESQARLEQLLTTFKIVPGGFPKYTP